MAARKPRAQPAKGQPKRNRPLATFSLSREVLEALEELARHQGVSKSAVVEQAVRAEARARGVVLR